MDSLHFFTDLPIYNTYTKVPWPSSQCHGMGLIRVFLPCPKSASDSYIPIPWNSPILPHKILTEFLFLIGTKYLTWGEIMAQFFCPSRFRKYVHFLGKTSWHDRWDYYITGICSEYAPKPPQPLAKIWKIAKIDMEAKNL